MYIHVYSPFETCVTRWHKGHAVSRREKLVWPEHSGFASWRRGLWTSWLRARVCHRESFLHSKPPVVGYCVTEVLMWTVCRSVQYTSLFLSVFLPVEASNPEILQGSWCREAQGLAVPEDHAIYRTVSGLQEGGLQVWHFMLAWNIMQCCRKSRMSTFSCS